MKDLTQRQIQIMIFIMAFFSDEDRLPTTREIAKHFNLASQTGVIGHLRALVKKGYLEQRASPDKARGWWRFTRKDGQ